MQIKIVTVMAVYSVFVVSRGGSLIYDLDYNVPKTDIEKTFSYPLDIVLKVFDEKLAVDFGARDGIKSEYSFWLKACSCTCSVLYLL